MHGSQQTTNAFKNFEKQTICDWDIVQDDLMPNTNLNEFYFPISIQDSEEVAKRIIKSHQEKNAKSDKNNDYINELDNSISSSPLARKSLSPKQNVLSKTISVPGKALRQEMRYNYQNNNDSTSQKVNQLTNLLHSAKISSNSDTENTSTTNINHISNTHSDTNKKNDLNRPSENNSNNNNSISSSQITSTTVTTSKPINNNGVYVYSKSEDPARYDKFKQILNKDPIDIEELHKASWKGIPKAFRSTCWKVLSVSLHFKIFSFQIYFYFYMKTRNIYVKGQIY